MSSMVFIIQIEFWYSAFSYFCQLLIYLWAAFSPLNYYYFLDLFNRMDPKFDLVKTFYVDS